MIRIPPRDVLLDTTSVFTILLPPVLTYFGTAFLSLIPGTRLLKLAILPVHLYLSFRAGTMLELSGGVPGRAFLNQVIMVRLCLPLSFYVDV